jgi:hypothetical protein
MDNASLNLRALTKKVQIPFTVLNTNVHTICPWFLEQIYCHIDRQKEGNDREQGWRRGVRNLLAFSLISS